MSQANSETTTLPAVVTRPRPTCYPYALSDADERSEITAQCFAATHILTALTGLQMCRAQAATGFARAMLDDHIAGLRDALADVRGWQEQIHEAAIETASERRRR